MHRGFLLLWGAIHYLDSILQAVGMSKMHTKYPKDRKTGAVSMLHTTRVCELSDHLLGPLLSHDPNTY